MNELPTPYNCWECGVALARHETRHYAGHEYCENCLDFAADPEPHLDTESLADFAPELYGYVHNHNPWGMEGGY